MKKTLIFIYLLCCFYSLQAKTILVCKDSSISQTGLKLGFSPIFAYNSDLGLLYGGVLNLFNYSGSSIYPDYKYSIYQELSRSTLGSTKLKTKFDSKNLFPKIRIHSELIIRDDKTLNFYGFNGILHSQERKNGYGNYFQIERKIRVIRPSILYKLGEKVNLYGGTGFIAIDINNLMSQSLFDKLNENNFIPEEQMNGGENIHVEYGITYDSRDNEKNPKKGIWSELFMMSSLYNSQQKYFQKLIGINRTYHKISKKTIIATRIGIQLDLSKETPFYLLPYTFSTTEFHDGIGGFNSIRGLMQNRVVGKSENYFNVELRHTFFEGILFNKNIFITATPFIDGETIVHEYMKNHDFNTMSSKSSIFLCTGSGIRVGINNNFILSFDYGISLNPKYPSQGFYSGLNFSF